VNHVLIGEASPLEPGTVNLAEHLQILVEASANPLFLQAAAMATGDGFGKPGRVGAGHHHCDLLVRKLLKQFLEDMGKKLVMGNEDEGGVECILASALG
jgi:hypothetical protein